MKTTLNIFTRSIAVAIALCLLAGCGGGGGGGGGGSQSTTLTGIVRDSLDKDNGVSGATVVIGGKSAITTTTDQASSTNPVGSFTMRDVPTGVSTAVVTKPGGTAQTVGFYPPITNGANGPITLTINIGQIKGRVLLSNGQPASSAFVTIVSTGDNVQTATDGTFFVDLIPTTAAAPTTTDVTAVLSTSTVTKNITVAVGLNDIGDIKLVDATTTTPPGLPYTIIGHVSLSNNTAAGASVGAIVQLSKNGFVVEQTAVNSAGDYVFYQPVGTYTVTVSLPAYATKTDTVTVTNPSTPARLDVALTAQ